MVKTQCEDVLQEGTSYASFTWWNRLSFWLVKTMLCD